MAIDDLRTRQQPKPEPEPVSQADVLQGMLALIAEMRSAQTDGQKEAALKQAEVMERLLIKTRPENAEHPGISVYSYPEGELKRPKPVLRAPTIWAGRQLTGDVETPEEIDLLNRLQPGDHRVMKADGKKIKFTVKLTHDDNGKLENVNCWFPTKGDDRQNHGSMLSYCRQVLGDHIPDATELLAEITRLKEELRLASVGAGRV